MILVDALVTMARRRHEVWMLTAGEVLLLRKHMPEGTKYVTRILTDPATQLWTAMSAEPGPEDGVHDTLEEALARLVAQGKRDALLGDRWLPTAQGMA
jgi:hypothetical protein